MKSFVKNLILLVFPILLLFPACFGGASSVDEDYHPGTPVKSAARLEFSSDDSHSAIDTGDAYDFGRVMVGNFKEVSFSIKNAGDSTAKDITSLGLTEAIRYKGGSYPGVGGTCGQNLEGKKSCLLVLEFIPTTIENFSIILTLNYGSGKASNLPQSSQKEITAEGYSVSPEMTELAPLHGAAIGGTTVTFTGKYFREGLSVTFDGSPCTNLVVASSSSFSCVAPAHNVGTVDLILTNEFGQRSGYISAFTYYAAPVVTNVSPIAGAIGGGTNITITGSSFRNGATVSVGGSSCTSVSVNSATSITCTTSAHGSGVADIVVTNSDLQSGTGSGLYTYQAAPTITAIFPSRIYTAGRDVTLTGTGFFSGATVSVGGSACTSPVVNSSTSLTCTTAASVSGTYSIVVTNTDAQTGTLTNGLTVADNDVWIPTTTLGAPSIRFFATKGVWTGSKALFWSGTDYLIDNTGGLYDPVTDSWANTTTTAAPVSRGWYYPVWTGSKMLVWGGYDGSSYNTGASYDPATDTWSTINNTNAPEERMYIRAVWTGSKMLVWGGRNNTLSHDLNTGGIYDLETDSWSAMSTTGAPSPRHSSSIVWTGSKMIAWGGISIELNATYNTGAIYDLQTDTWSAMTTTGAPLYGGVRYYGGALAHWTGSKMLVWLEGTGGQYDPLNNSWSAITTSGAPTARYRFASEWSGGKLLLWGGNSSSDESNLNSGSIYDPISNAWVAMASTTQAPTPRTWPASVWTGGRMIVWSGSNNGEAGRMNTGGMYIPPTDPASNTWTTMTTSGAPAHCRGGQGAVWTGSKMLVWGGSDGGFQNTGSLYDPVSNSWSAISTTNAPAVRDRFSTIWTGNKMIIWGGGYSIPAVNTGGQYDPLTDTWTPTSTIDSPSPRFVHSAVWTGSKMIIVGGLHIDVVNYFKNDGGIYDPVANTWSVTSTTNTPPVISESSAIWTGSKMIAWGGNSGGSANNLGGLYDPVSNTWSTMTTTDAPSPRRSVSAVWTGSKMITWGGSDYPTTCLNTGGIYDPIANSWSSTSTAGAPTARYSHSLIWTGSRMIAWGGLDTINTLNDGGRYDPSTNQWNAISSTNAPSIRSSHSAVWNGSKIIIWGGSTFNTGGIYIP